MKPSNLVAYIATPLVLFALTGRLSKVSAEPSLANVNRVHSLQDPGYQATTADQIFEDLKSSPNNPLALYNAVRQAGHNGLELAAYADLRKLVKADPDNSNLLAAECFAYGVTRGDYDINGYHWVPGSDFIATSYYDAELAKVEHLDPNLWLVYLLKAQPTIYPGNGNRAAALRYLRKAVALAPDLSYTHYALAYLLLEPNVSSPSERAEGVREDETATRLKPVNAQAAWLLFETYAFDMHDRAKALAAEKVFLSEIPSGFKLSSGELGLMSNYSKGK